MQPTVQNMRIRMMGSSKGQGGFGKGIVVWEYDLCKLLVAV